MPLLRVLALLGSLFIATSAALAATDSVATDATIDAAVTSITPRVIEWRRDLHQHPELGNRETRTAARVASQLKELGLEVRTGVAHTGVVAVLRGGRPGPTVALRADMDALPVTEQGELPFRSTVTTQYRGETVGVMHACGHDGHTAVLLGAAQVLAGMRAQLPGTVIFVFQPAEEGAPEGERGGAALMAKEGVFGALQPDAVFALHFFSSLNTGDIGYRSGSMLAGSDRFRIRIRGAQTHGARPWNGIDPIVVASQVVMGLQTIVSRQTDITRYPAVLSIGSIKGGIRFNIIPDAVEMSGTMRTFDDGVRKELIAAVQRTASNIAASAGATAEVEFADDPNPVTANDPALTARMLPSLRRAAGAEHVLEVPYNTVAEDFPQLAPTVPSLYFQVGSTPIGRDAAQAPANHSPLFFLDEAALPVGLRALLGVTLDFLQGPPG